MNGMWRISIAPILLICLDMWLFPVQVAGAEKTPPDEDMGSVAASGNAFALDMFSRLADAGRDDNVFFSPASITTALAMTYGGARGETATGMRAALHFELDDERLHPAMGALADSLNASTDGYELNLANALWGQKGHPFAESYLALNRDFYGAGLEELDFKSATEQSRNTINRWVENHTNDRIKNLIAPGVLTPMTRLVLTNAIYFKGTWKTRFDPEHTRTEPFHLASGGTVQVPLMHLRGSRFPYVQDGDLQILEMPYSGERVSMVLLLPGDRAGLEKLEDSLSIETLDGWLERMHVRELDDVAVPRFKMTRQYSLASHLAKMGMDTAFGPGADFSGMTGARDLFISEVAHKAFVEVNEEGTEAAAATAVVMKATAYSEPLVFRADRPFVFLLRDRDSGAILFMGRVLNPS